MDFRQIVRSSPLGSLAISVRTRARLWGKGLTGRLHPLQSAKTSRDYPLIRLGSDYGGWVLVDEPALHGGVVLSAGLGEDGSFDVEFAARYGARVVIVDPTPRSVAHFEMIKGRVGLANEKPYDVSGAQDARAYDLSKVTEAQLVLAERALWNENGCVKFYLPKNPEHVSHSIVNYQNEYAQDTSFIEVRAVTMTTLLRDLDIEPSSVQLVKLDIEGAEIETLQAMVADGFLPRQLLVEFDELLAPSERGFARVTAADAMLRASGYRLLHTDGQANFLYYRPA